MTGLTIHRCERADPLVAALGVELSTPVGDPFAAEVVAVPSRGVERWLAQQLSHVLGALDGDGVCANVVFPSATTLLDDALAAAAPEYAAAVEQWAGERAVWPLMAIIDTGLAGSAWAAPLAAHLEIDSGRRFAVSHALARHFASYARARPAMLRAWRAGRDEQGDATPLPDDLRWQAELWRRLRAEIGPSPAELVDDACVRLRAEPDAVALPARFSIFGPTRLSATRIAALDALAAHRDVHLWVHHPSPALWDSVAAAATTTGRRRDDAMAAAVRNPLLASLSRDVREMQQLLPVAADVHHDIGVRPATVLGRLQDELARDAVPERPGVIEPGDRSLSVHACHGPARQLEVVREVVLGLLRDDPTLEPRDVLVMCPDVETFAPLVAASFGMADEPGGHPAGQLRVRLADRSLRQTNPLLGLLGQVLELAGDRVTATELLDLAGAPPVRRRFGFTDDDVERLREWTTSGNARWGLDAEHRAPYGLAGIDQGTWRSAIDRLLLGVAMEDDGRWLGPVLPLDDVDSGDIDLAGRFAELVDRVDTAVRAFARPHTVPQWSELLAGTVLGLGEPLQAWQGAQLHGELDDAAEAAAGTDVVLTRAEIAALLQARLAGRPTRASFRTGTLTVCTLVPMRSVPHRVVCLVGMDDGAFPRHGTTDGDDVLARDPRIGERDVRSEDRQLFLDAICAAQEHLVITYTGADPRSGVEVPPCVPLGELLDALDSSSATADGRPARAHVVVRHPLQPFDPRNFTGADPFSFDPIALAGARATTAERRDPPVLVAGPLTPPPAGDVELEDLVRFLVHPARAFLRQRLEISTWESDDDPVDSLAVSLDKLEQWSVGDRLLRNRLAGMTSEACREIEHRRGDLPPGQLGRRVLSEVGQAVDALLAACEVERRLEPVHAEVSVPLDDARRVVGTIGGLRGRTLLSVTYSNLGAKHRLEAWVRYLALLATTGDTDLQAVAVGKRRGGTRRAQFLGLDPVEARGVLADLVALRDDGLREPLPLAVATSEAYADRRNRRQDHADALDAARQRWQTQPGKDSFRQEDVDPAHLLVHGGTLAFDDLIAAVPRRGEERPDEPTRFGALAMRVWTPLLSTEIEGRA